MAVEDSIRPVPGRLDPWYVTGLTDGEGCFKLRYYRDKRKNAPHRDAEFAIALRADDLPILEQLQEFFGCGRLRFTKRSRSPRGLYTSNPLWQFAVNKTCDIESKVVAHFRLYPLQAKKARDFLVWERGVVLVSQVVRRKAVWGGGPRGGIGSRWTSAEHEEFLSLRAALKAQRVYQAPPVALPPPRPRPPQPPTLFDGLP